MNNSMSYKRAEGQFYYLVLCNVCTLCALLRRDKVVFSSHVTTFIFAYVIPMFICHVIIVAYVFKIRAVCVNLLIRLIYVYFSLCISARLRIYFILCSVLCNYLCLFIFVYAYTVVTSV